MNQSTACLIFTWKDSQALDYLTTSGLHGNPVIAHEERKHDEGHKLAGVGLQGTKSQSVRVVILIKVYIFILIFIH